MRDRILIRFLYLLLLVLQNANSYMTENRFFDYTKRGKAVATVILPLKTDKVAKCIHQCVLNNQCESVNFNNKTKDCELLKERWEASNILFTNDNDWAYYGYTEKNQKKIATKYAIYQRNGANLYCNPSTNCVQATSCQKIKELCNNCQSGFYWLLIADDYVKALCDMETVSATSSCKKIKELCNNCQSGFYWLLIADDYVKAFCDMETDSGGWMMIGNVTVINEDDRFNKILDEVKSTNIKSLSQVDSGAFALSITALRSLKSIMGFTEIRVKCYKPWHQRTFHIVFKSQKVISTMLMENGYTAGYQVCKSGQDINFLPDDNSKLGQENCFTAGSIYIMDEMLYNHAIWVEYFFHVHIVHQNRMDCDDFPEYYSNERYTGWWQYFVR